MSAEIHTNVDMIRAADAAVQFGYTRDYVTKLARLGKVRGVKINDEWFVEPDSMATFFEMVRIREHKRRAQLKTDRTDEYRHAQTRDTVTYQASKKPTATMSWFALPRIPTADMLLYGKQFVRLLSATAGVALVVGVVVTSVHILSTARVANVSDIASEVKQVARVDVALPSVSVPSVVITDVVHAVRLEEIFSQKWQQQVRAMQATAAHATMQIAELTSRTPTLHPSVFNSIGTGYAAFTTELAALWLERAEVGLEVARDVLVAPATAVRWYEVFGEIVYVQGVLPLYAESGTALHVAVGRVAAILPARSVSLSNAVVHAEPEEIIDVEVHVAQAHAAYVPTQAFTEQAKQRAEVFFESVVVGVRTVLNHISTAVRTLHVGAVFEGVPARIGGLLYSVFGDEQ